MQSVLYLDDRTVIELVDPVAAQRAVDDAFAAWGRGEAATTQRVRASADGGMASAMAAVVPPYCGGKLYATNAGRFTFLDVLAGAHVVVTVTSATNPLFPATAISDDTLICAVGATKAGDAPVLFETQGVAIQDVAVCALACERYVQQTNVKEGTDDHVPPTFARRG